MTREKRISLANNCSCTHPKAFPANWNKPGADISIAWSIRYRFYDPAFKEKYPNGKQVPIKDMNCKKKLQERRELTKLLIRNELDMLKNRAYNPITETSADPSTDITSYELEPSTPFIEAIDEAYKQLSCGEGTKDDVRKALVHIKHAIRQKHFDQYAICDVKRRHIIFLLKQIGKNINAKNNNKWTASNFNHYRSYLIMLFNELSRMDVNEIDLGKIKKMTEIKRIRETLTELQAIAVNKYLHGKYYTFWRFFVIFFQSGARIEEMMKVKKEGVDLAGQRFKATILKGQQYEEEWKTITLSALPLWEELMAEANAGDYLFSKFLRPGPLKINSHQITKRWRLHVKQSSDEQIRGLNITADFYALKHLFTTMVVTGILEEQENAVEKAAEHNNHKGSAMVKSIYDTKYQSRKHEKLKKVSVNF